MKNIALLKKIGVSDNTIDDVMSIIECSPSFIEGKITPQKVAEATRKTLIQLTNELLENIPESDFDKYEEGIVDEDIKSN